MSNCDPLKDGNGYANSMFRVECRPSYGFHSRDDLLKMLDVIAEAGVNAWWYSAAAKGSYPLFRSKYLPYRSDAVDIAEFQWLSGQVHDRGMAFFSWEYLTTAPILADEKPEWRWKLFDWDGPKIPRDTHYVCWNSPYGELLKKYSLEIVQDLGFDGIWFDGSFLHGHGMTGKYACCCEFCAEKYRRQTGKNIPAGINLNDQDCKEFFMWRYEDHMSYWRELSEYVKSRKNDAIVAYNYFNRFGNGLDSGCPLEHLERDHTSMIAAETGFHYQQTLVLSKSLRSVSDNYTPEIWTYLADSPNSFGAHPDAATLIYHANMCAASGSFPSYGAVDIENNYLTFKNIADGVKGLEEYVGGESAAVVGIVLSGTTKDFAHIAPNAQDTDDTVTWNQVCGINSLFDALHIQSDIVFDNMLCQTTLQQYQMIVLPGVECISQAGADALLNYVEQGGTLLAIGDCGLRDEWGNMREQGILDNIFGITFREDLPAKLTLDNLEVLPGTGRAVLTNGKVLHSCTYRLLNERQFNRDGIIQPDPAGIKEAHAISSKKYGKGTALFMAVDVAFEYAFSGSHRGIRKYMFELISPYINAPLQTDAPPWVTINMFQKGDQTIIHLLDTPETMIHLAMEYPNRKFPDINLPCDFNPIGPIKITVPGKWEKACVPLADKRILSTEILPDKMVLRIELFTRHLVIALTSR